MHLYDIPISTSEEDLLNRSEFSEKLAASLIEWKGNESFVIGLFGEWGSGKTSILNLVRQTINKTNNDFTIIEFNPWHFSELNKLSFNFFNEISKSLNIKNESESDKKLVKKLKKYSYILGLFPDKSLLQTIASKLLIGLGLLGITSSQIINWLNLDLETLKYILFIVGFLFITFEFLKEFLNRVIKYVENKLTSKNIPLLDFKNDIRNELKNRKKKLLIIIDDIDRLSSEEMKEIFKLIKANADFPNTIFLLSFDNIIIQKNLEIQPGISGKDYLEKIVQVNFNVPFIGADILSKFLFSELDKILENIPSFEKYFDHTRWANIYHSGYKNFFQNIRAIKRYINSLQFNISLLHKDGVLEVNPIDFIAIESIRVFAQEFYHFMRSRKSLFTDELRDNSLFGNRANSENELRKSEIESALDMLEPSVKENLLLLLPRLFPQLKRLLQNSHSYDSNQSEWEKSLRVCSPSCYDTYFTLNAESNEQELSNYEMQKILNSISELDSFEEILRDSFKNAKLNKILTKIQNYTSDKEIIQDKDIENIIMALFNISDDMPDIRSGTLELGPDTEILRITYQLCTRDLNQEKNYQLFRKIIPHSRGLFGPIQMISYEIRDNNSRRSDFCISEENLEELKKLCVVKIKESAQSKTLFHNRNFLYILYRWKFWDDSNDYQKYIDQIVSSNKDFLSLLSKFIYEQKSFGMDDIIGRSEKKLNIKELTDFFKVEDILNRLKKIKESSELHKENREIIEFILNKLET